MQKKRNEVILVIDDSPDTLELIHRSIEYMGFEVHSFEQPKEAIEFLESNPVDLVVTDYHMPFIGGKDVIKHVRENYPETEVMVITGYASVEGAIEAIKTGAEEYLSKPFTDEELQDAIEKSLRKLAGRRNQDHAYHDSFSSYGLIFNSKSMKKLMRNVKKAADSDMPVLIMGEKGTGKELAARTVHYESKSNKSPFLYVNCSDTPDNYIESEIFGYVDHNSKSAGEAFKKGYLELAKDGTVFFDEISELSLSVQIKLLRVLSEKETIYAGDDVPKKVKCRIIASSSRDLLALVRRGLFREDLFFKLNTLSISVPPLRERENDGLLICNYYLKKYCKENDVVGTLTLSEQAKDAIINYNWPGNVREIKAYMYNLSQKNYAGVVELADLPGPISSSLKNKTLPPKTLSEIELEHITAVLETVDGNKTKAAQLLGIDRKTLRTKLEQK